MKLRKAFLWWSFTIVAGAFGGWSAGVYSDFWPMGGLIFGALIGFMIGGIANVVPRMYFKE